MGGGNVNKVTAPVNAMLVRAEGQQVAVVGQDGKIQLRHISIGRDYGTTLEILGGVSPSDQIIINPPDSLEDGQEVNVAQPPPQNQPAQNPPAQNQPGENQRNSSQKGSK